MLHKKIFRVLVFILCVGFVQKGFAQEVAVINNKGTIQNIIKPTVAEIYCASPATSQVINEGAFSDINFGTAGIVDTDDYTIGASANQITIETVGRYEIIYRVTAENNVNSRTGCEFYLEVRGSEANGTRAYTYTRNNLVNRNTVTVSKIVDLSTVPAIVKVKGQVYNSSQTATSATATITNNGASLIIKRIK